MTILLTGGTGILGHEFIQQSSDKSNIIALARNPEKLPEGITPLQGDLLQPELALKDFSLLTNVETIYHMAANTKWNLSDEEALRINCLGTQELIEVAKKHCPKLKHFIYVSTAFVDTYSHPKSDTALNRNNYNNSYEFSKAHAEDAVRNSSLPYSIIRPSIIIGRSTDGSIHNYSGIYQIFGVFFSGQLPAIVGFEDTYLDMVPVDDVAHQLQKINTQDPKNTTYYVSSGQHTLTLKSLIEILREEISKNPAFTHTPEFPSFVNPDTFQRFFLPMIKQNSMIPLQKYLNVIKYFQPYFSIRTQRVLDHRVNLANNYDMQQILRVCFQHWTHKNTHKIKLFSRKKQRTLSSNIKTHTTPIQQQA
ncbi:MAG: SDR family oxidoreductase [Oligoflexales bacterium]